MATKAMMNKAMRTPKFKVRGYNRCPICGRPRAFYRKFGICIGQNIVSGKCPAIYIAEIHLIENRGVYDTQIRLIIYHKGDIYSELTVSLDKFLSAVQRVYKPEKIPITALLIE